MSSLFRKFKPSSDRRLSTITDGDSSLCPSSQSSVLPSLQNSRRGTDTDIDEPVSPRARGTLLSCDFGPIGSMQSIASASSGSGKRRMSIVSSMSKTLTQKMKGFVGSRKPSVASSMVGTVGDSLPTVASDEDQVFSEPSTTSEPSSPSTRQLSASSSFAVDELQRETCEGSIKLSSFPSSTEPNASPAISRDTSMTKLDCMMEDFAEMDWEQADKAGKKDARKKEPTKPGIAKSQANPKKINVNLSKASAPPSRRTSLELKANAENLAVEMATVEEAEQAETKEGDRSPLRPSNSKTPAGFVNPRRISAESKSIADAGLKSSPSLISDAGLKSSPSLITAAEADTSMTSSAFYDSSVTSSAFQSNEDVTALLQNKIERLKNEIQALKQSKGILEKERDAMETKVLKAEMEAKHQKALSEKHKAEAEALVEKHKAEADALVEKHKAEAEEAQVMAEEAQKAYEDLLASVPGLEEFKRHQAEEKRAAEERAAAELCAQAESEDADPAPEKAEKAVKKESEKPATRQNSSKTLTATRTSMDLKNAEKEATEKARAEKAAAEKAKADKAKEEKAIADSAARKAALEKVASDIASRDKELAARKKKLASNISGEDGVISVASNVLANAAAQTASEAKPIILAMEKPAVQLRTAQKSCNPSNKPKWNVVDQSAAEPLFGGSSGKADISSTKAATTTKPSLSIARTASFAKNAVSGEALAPATNEADGQVNGPVHTSEGSDSAPSASPPGLMRKKGRSKTNPAPSNDGIHLVGQRQTSN